MWPHAEIGLIKIGIDHLSGNDDLVRLVIMLRERLYKYSLENLAAIGAHPLVLGIIKQEQTWISHTLIHWGLQQNR